MVGVCQGLRSRSRGVLSRDAVSTASNDRCYDMHPPIPGAAISVDMDLTHTFTMTGPRPHALEARARVAPPVPSNEALAANYSEQARAIEARHAATRRSRPFKNYAADTLRRFFGCIPVWEAIEMLGRCIDPTDCRLFGASQHLHVLQILDAMENEGTASEEFVLAALLHDLGKVLLITGEMPENVVCMNDPIAAPAAGAGLDNGDLQWNHDEFAWSRLRSYLPDPVAWLIAITASTSRPAANTLTPATATTPSGTSTIRPLRPRHEVAVQPAAPAARQLPSDARGRAPRLNSDLAIAAARSLAPLARRQSRRQLEAHRLQREARPRGE